MNNTKLTRVTETDIRSLEIIYADGRVMGRLLHQKDEDLRKAFAKISELEAQVRTLSFRLRQSNDLYAKASGVKLPRYGNGLRGPFEKKPTHRSDLGQAANKS